MSLNAMQTLYPGVLRAGDAVALVSPAGPVPAAKVESAAQILESWGLKPRIYPHALDTHSFYAGTDEHRLADFNAALADPEIRAIFCNRGGYGAQRIVEQLDFDAVRRDPKLVIGFSDITAIHAALWNQTRLATIHGPVAAQLERGGVFTSSVWHATMSTAPILVTANAAEPTFDVRTGGAAEGILRGGNLSILSTSIGTSFMPDLHGAILLIEDVGEVAYRVDRMLTHLLNSGVLDGVAGIAVGQFSEPRGASGTITPSSVLMERLAGLGVPLVGGLSIGHGDINYAVPLGTQASLDAESGTLLVAPTVR
ncbi:peptidase U61, LD-carboxypeptidase A [Paucimonas lemoignei]|jgi:muramoyltetrapeptide carboxypeptidase|nr:peptidase U61, LD-carboxypeptidase A [Paucimonas lemoignei]